MRGVFDEAVAHLGSARGGYEVVEIELPFLRQGQYAHAATCLTEGADAARARVSARDGADWLRPLSLANRVLAGTGAQTPATDLLRYGQLRQVIMAHLAHLFDRYPGLLVLTPTTPLAGWPVHPGDARYGFTDGNMAMRNMTYVWYANTSGCPAVTCPAGYVPPPPTTGGADTKTRAAKDDGGSLDDGGDGKLPVGLMAMGEWGAEEQLLGFARDVESYLNQVYPGGRQRPAEWADIIGMATVNSS